MINRPARLRPTDRSHHQNERLRGIAEPFVSPATRRADLSFRRTNQAATETTIQASGYDRQGRWACCYPSYMPRAPPRDVLMKT
jgi:hypothetical protein